eukprot:203767-Hanusia_phi.AAC.1
MEKAARRMREEGREWGGNIGRVCGWEWETWMSTRGRRKEGKGMCWQGAKRQELDVGDGTAGPVRRLAEQNPSSASQYENFAISCRRRGTGRSRSHSSATKASSAGEL